jgi:hypothetical protein
VRESRQANTASSKDSTKMPTEQDRSAHWLCFFLCCKFLRLLNRKNALTRLAYDDKRQSCSGTAAHLTKLMTEKVKLTKFYKDGKIELEKCKL